MGSPSQDREWKQITAVEAFYKMESAQICGALSPCPGLTHPYHAAPTENADMNSSVGDLFYCNKSLIRKPWIFFSPSKRLRLASAEPLVRFVSGRFHDSVKDSSDRSRD